MKIKKLLPVILLVAFVAAIEIACATNDFSNSIHRHYLATTKLMASGGHTARGEVIDGIALYVDHINNSLDQASTFSTVRVHMRGSADTMWESNKPWSFLNGRYTRDCDVAILKGYTYEFYTGSTQINGVIVEYYANSSQTSAYAYLKEMIP